MHAAMRPFRGSNMPYASTVAVIPAAIDIYELMRVQRRPVCHMSRWWRGFIASDQPFRPSAGRLAVGTLVSRCEVLGAVDPIIMCDPLTLHTILMCGRWRQSVATVWTLNFLLASKIGSFHPAV